jgi:hypothetical protein
MKKGLPRHPPVSTTALQQIATAPVENKSSLNNLNLLRH